jgi:hypothetical protein
MPRGEKSSYTDKQKRQARHIEESYEGRGKAVAERGAAAAVITRSTWSPRLRADAWVAPPPRASRGALGSRKKNGCRHRAARH